LFSKPTAAVLLLSFANACGDDEGDVSGTGGSAAGSGTGGSAGSAGRAGSAGSAGRGGSSNAGGSSGGTSNMAGSGAGQDPPVVLGTSGDYAILAKTGIDTVPPSVITGDLGCSPAAATYITGFALTADSTTTFASSPQVTGRVYASTYTSPTPSKLTTAISDMETAFTDAAGRAPDFTEKGAGDIGGLTLVPGTYQWSTGLLIPTDVTLTGGSTAVWIFQIAENLTVANGAEVVLAGGALPKNVFWQVSGTVEVGTTAHLEGIVLSQTAITLGTGASINGRLLAQTAVNIRTSTVVEPD
jgi:hypothetical protein